MEGMELVHSGAKGGHGGGDGNDGLVASIRPRFPGLCQKFIICDLFISLQSVKHPPFHPPIGFPISELCHVFIKDPSCENQAYVTCVSRVIISWMEQFS